MTYTIYGLFDEGDPLVIRYVGFSRHPEKRHRQHLTEAVRSRARSHRLSWIRKVLSEGRQIAWRALATADSAEAAAQAEMDLIREICTQPHRLVNGTEGGEGVQGFGGVLSEDALARRNATLNSSEFRQLRSELSTEYWASDEARDHQRDAMRRHYASPESEEHRERTRTVAKMLWEQPGHGDRVHNPEAREKMRAAKLGKPHAAKRTAEWNAKISAAQKGRPKPQSAEMKAKRAAAMARPETRERMRLAALARHARKRKQHEEASVSQDGRDHSEDVADRA